ISNADGPQARPRALPSPERALSGLRGSSGAGAREVPFRARSRGRLAPRRTPLPASVPCPTFNDLGFSPSVKAFLRAPAPSFREKAFPDRLPRAGRVDGPARAGGPRVGARTARGLVQDGRDPEPPADSRASGLLDPGLDEPEEGARPFGAGGSDPRLPGRGAARDLTGAGSAGRSPPGFAELPSSFKPTGGASGGDHGARIPDLQSRRLGALLRFGGGRGESPVPRQRGLPAGRDDGGRGGLPALPGPAARAEPGSGASPTGPVCGRADPRQPGPGHRLRSVLLLSAAGVRGPALPAGPRGAAGLR